MAGGGKGAVFAALVGNGFLTVIKFAAFVVSGSGAMMSEAVHSFADTANQALLYIGLQRSVRPADDEFHYGYGADRFVFALLSAAGIFFLGCGVTVYHGIHSLMHPPQLELSWLTFAVLGIALLVDGYVFVSAIREVNHRRGNKGFLEYVRTTTDPTLIAVLFEDFVASLGVLVAMGGILMAWYTGNPVYDAISSIIIGTFLGVLAIWLGMRNRYLILGPAIPSEVSSKVAAFLREHPAVARVRELKTRIVAADRFRIAAEVDYDGRYLGRLHAEWLSERIGSADEIDWEVLAADIGERLMDALGAEVDRIEAELGERFPRVGHVDLEAD